MYFPVTTKAVLSSLVCVIAVANLNYFRPPRNKLVFNIAEVAFLGTTFKYLGVVAATAGGNSSISNVDVATLGMAMMVVDMVVVLGGFVTAVLILVNFRRKHKAVVGHHKTQNIASNLQTKGSTPLQSRRRPPNRQQQRGEEEELELDQQIHRKKIVDKMQHGGVMKRTVSARGQAFAAKVVNMDQAIRTQERHNQSKAMSAKKMEKKKVVAQQRLDSRLKLRKSNSKRSVGRGAGSGGAGKTIERTKPTSSKVVPESGEVKKGNAPAGEKKTDESHCAKEIETVRLLLKKKSRSINMFSKIFKNKRIDQDKNGALSRKEFKSLIQTTVKGNKELSDTLDVYFEALWVDLCQHCEHNVVGDVKEVEVDLETAQKWLFRE